MSERIDIARNRDDEQKPGSPNRMAQEPDGAEHSADSAKTLTDPVSGAPLNESPEPNASEAPR